MDPVKNEDAPTIKVSFIWLPNIIGSILMIISHILWRWISRETCLISLLRCSAFWTSALLRLDSTLSIFSWIRWWAWLMPSKLYFTFYSLESIYLLQSSILYSMNLTFLFVFMNSYFKWTYIYFISSFMRWIYKINPSNVFLSSLIFNWIVSTRSVNDANEWLYSIFVYY